MILCFIKSENPAYNPGNSKLAAAWSPQIFIIKKNNMPVIIAHTVLFEKDITINISYNQLNMIHYDSNGLKINNPFS